MSADAKIQVNFKGGKADLINVYAQDENEAIELLQALSNPILVAAITDAEAELGQFSAVGFVKASFPKAQVVGNTQTTTDVLTCDHGARVRREGKSAKGPWGAWFCPQTSGSKCDPLWDEKK